MRRITYSLHKRKFDILPIIQLEICSIFYFYQIVHDSFGVVQLDGELIPFAELAGKRGAGGRRASKVDR